MCCGSDTSIAQAPRSDTKPECSACAGPGSLRWRDALPWGLPFSPDDGPAGLKLFHPAQFRARHAAVAGAPAAERLAAHAVLAAKLRGWNAGPGFGQNLGDLLIAKTGFSHRRTSSIGAALPHVLGSLKCSGFKGQRQQSCRGLSLADISGGLCHYLLVVRPESIRIKNSNNVVWFDFDAA